MKITAIEKSKGERYTVYVDDEYWYILDLEIIAGNHLKAGLEVDEDFLDDLMRQAERRKARERAYYLLGYRDHSKKELYDKLLKNARPEICTEIIELVESQGLLNDEDYADKLANYYLNSKKWGQKRTYMELLKRGIDKDLIADAINCCEVDYISNIKEIIERRYYDSLDDYKSRQKVITALLRMGYKYDDIKNAMSEYE